MQEMMANFDDEGGKPVSAVFTAPIPRDSTDGPPATKDELETFPEGANCPAPPQCG
jgi:hypothetical protein